MRKSNFELLRVFSMLFIIMGHLCDQTGIASMLSPETIGLSQFGGGYFTV